jgi:hypothetical protein
VTEQQDVVEELTASGVLGGVRWAYRSAVTRTLATFSEADGHDAALLGNLRHTLFRDRIDRVFACGRYELQAASTGTDHLDLLLAELSDDDVRSMPQIPPGVVRRADLTNSPGWAIGNTRFLLAACDFGKLGSLPWTQRSPTKQRVAMQTNPDPDQPSLFDDASDDELALLVDALADSRRLDMTTFVVAHTLDVVGHALEIVLGRPRLNHDGGAAWHWVEDLLSVPPSEGGHLHGAGPTPAGPEPVPDAPVRLRRPGDEQRNNRAKGDA